MFKPFSEVLVNCRSVFHELIAEADEFLFFVDLLNLQKHDLAAVREQGCLGLIEPAATKGALAVALIRGSQISQSLCSTQVIESRCRESRAVQQLTPLSRDIVNQKLEFLATCHDVLLLDRIEEKTGTLYFLEEVLL